MRPIRWSRTLLGAVVDPGRRRALRRRARRQVLALVEDHPDVPRRLLTLLAETSVGRATLEHTPYPPAGTALPGVDPGRLPVALVVLWGAGPADAAQVVQEVVEVQAASAGFRPVFLFDGPHLRVARQHGLLAELVVPEAAWGLVPQHQGWADYAQERMGDLLALYRPSVTVCADSGHLRPADLALLRSLRAVPA